MQDFNVTVCRDLVYEQTEVFNATLTNAIGGSIIVTPATMTIADDDAAPNLSVQDVSVNEAAGTASITVTQTGSTSTNTSFTFSTVDGTAQGNLDYIPQINGTGLIPAGATSTTIIVSIIDDNLFEINETFTLQLISAVNASINPASGADPVGLVTILENEAPNQISIGDVSQPEGNQGIAMFNFLITRVGDAQSNQTVCYDTINGPGNNPATGGNSSGPGIDYMSLTPGPANCVTFTQGGPSIRIVPVSVFGDALPEPEETFTVRLLNVTGGGVISDSSGLGTIQNDDANAVVSVSVAPSSVFEDGAANLVYTFSRTGSNALPLTVNFSVGGTAAFGTVPDYTQTGAATFTATSGTVTFPGEASTVTVMLDPIPDSTVEADETASFTLNSSTEYNVGSPSGATGTIINDDTDVTVSIVPPTSVPEDGSSNLVYSFSRSGVTATPLTVNFSVGGDATFGSDYTQFGASSFGAMSGSVTFAPGSTSAIVTIDPSSDALVELDEAVILTLTSAPGYNVSFANLATGTISNDDTARVSVSAVLPTAVTEDGTGTISFVFIRDGITANPLTLNLTVGGDATFGIDYSQAGAATFGPTSGSINFPAGDSTAILTIDPTQDTTFEPDETVTITIAPGTAYVTTFPNSDTGTILNDDPACPSTPINAGQAYSGLLDGTSCQVNGNRTDLYTFTGTAGESIGVTMNSAGFYTKLELLSPQGNSIQTGGGSSVIMDSRLPDSGLFVLPSTGSYTIRAIASFGGSGGSYVLTLFKAPGSCSYSLSSVQSAISADGGKLGFDVFTQPGCPSAAQIQPTGAIYSGLTYASGHVALNVSANSTASARQDVIVIAGLTYTINQYGLTPPSNDNFGVVLSQQALTGINSPVDAPIQGYSKNATAEIGEPSRAGIAASSSVWYSWTPPNIQGGNGLYTFSTSGSSFDTVMAVYACPIADECTFANMKLVGANDDTAFFDKTSRVNFQGTIGTKYMIAVDGKNAATGTVQLSWRQYRRLLRAYLQTYNGLPSTFVPTRIDASNEVTTVVPSLVSQGVYEFSLPTDNTLFTVTVEGPIGIVWSPFPLNTILKPNDESLIDAGTDSQIVIFNAQSNTDVIITGYIKNIANSEIPCDPDNIVQPCCLPTQECLAVATGYSRGTESHRTEDQCALAFAPKSSSVTVASGIYQCKLQPQTLHDIIPRQSGKKFQDAIHQFDRYYDSGFLVPFRDSYFEASPSPTFKISGRVMPGGPGTAVELFYKPAGIGTELSDRRTTDTNGNYEFRNLVEGQYRVKALRTEYVYNQPSPFMLQSNTVVDISAPAPCTYAPSKLRVSRLNGGVNQFNVVPSNANCRWSATGNVPWLVVNSGITVDAGSVIYTVEPNLGAAYRVGSISISGRAEPVAFIQLGSDPLYGSVTGRVLTPDLRPLRSALVTITDTLGNRQTVSTNSFGLYSVDRVLVGETLTVSVSSKHYRFSSLPFEMSDFLMNADFVGLE